MITTRCSYAIACVLLIVAGCSLSDLRSRSEARQQAIDVGGKASPTYGKERAAEITDKTANGTINVFAPEEATIAGVQQAEADMATRNAAVAFETAASDSGVTVAVNVQTRGTMPDPEADSIALNRDAEFGAVEQRAVSLITMQSDESNENDSSSGGSASPGTSDEAMALLNLLEFPRLPGAQIQHATSLLLDYTTENEKVDAALRFQIAELEKRGFEVDDSPGASVSVGNYQSQLMIKGGFVVDVAAVQHISNMIGVSVQHFGNVDARTLPVPDGAEAIDGSTAKTASYRNIGTIDEAIDDCRREMATRGWLEYERSAEVSPIPIEIEGTRVIPYVINGVMGYLYVSKHKAVNSGQPVLVYSLTDMIPHGLSVPVGVSRVQINADRGLVEYSEKGSIADVVRLLRKQASERGWQELRDREKRSSKGSQLLFVGPGGGEFAATIREEDYQVARVTIAFIEGEASVVAREQQPESAASIAAMEPATPDAAGDHHSMNKIAAGDFPLPTGAKRVGEELGTPVVMIDSDLGAEAVAKFYEESLGKLGWNRSSEFDVPADAGGTSVMVFNKDELSIQVIVQSTVNPFASIFAQGDGIDFRSKAQPSSANGISELAERMIPDRIGDELGVDAEPTAPINLDHSMASRAKNTGSARVIFGDEKVELKHALAYQFIDQDGFDGPEVVTGLLFTEKPMSAAKIQKELKRGADFSVLELMEFDFFEYLQVRIREGNVSYNCYVLGTSNSSGGNSDMATGLTVDRGWIHGKFGTTEPQQTFDKEFSFTASVDLAILQPSAEDLAMANDPERRLEERRGVPVPVDPIESMSSGTQYATSMEITTEITPDEMLATYQDETGDMGWVISGHEKLKSGDKLTFEGPQGELIVKITPTTNGSKVEANLRDANAAKADGMLPLPGKAKLILANASDKDVVITIGKNDYQVKGGVGADDPTKAINYDVAAGKYSLTIKVPRESPQKKSLVIEVGTSWGLIITPSGEAFADQIY